jgi:hypothetical protein
MPADEVKVEAQGEPVVVRQLGHSVTLPCTP